MVHVCKLIRGRQVEHWAFAFAKAPLTRTSASASPINNFLFILIIMIPTSYFVATSIALITAFIELSELC